ncbi:hypothetical protein EVAR_63181_1 [Eumeta japonica]|uniref:Uncharacterized protein n=1 Tax=Eumeta variegata TaxID=151549 RepID=A0A4C1Z398_EUMVA|nr:hypothetical protein EVAR_63181_1 [Eumeta japonica]
MSLMVIKTEYDVKTQSRHRAACGSLNYERTLWLIPACLSNRRRAQVAHGIYMECKLNMNSLPFKKDYFNLKTEDEAAEVTIKHELDIRPMVLQQKTVVGPLLLPDQMSKSSYTGGAGFGPLRGML